MPAKKSKKKLSLKPVEKKLKQILKQLESQQRRKGLPKQKLDTLEQDIKNVKGLIASLPPNCHANPSYDLGI